MLLTIIRHAHPDYKNDTITPDGHLEAEALSRRMKSYGLDRIFCSPLGRAQDTMQYTAKLLNIEPETEEWTRELSDVFLEDTEWGPLNAWDLPGEAMFDGKSHPASLDWDALPILKHLKLREQFAKLGEDSDRFLRKLGYAREGGRYRCVQPNEEKIAVFCHGGFGVTWIAHLLNIPLPIAWAGFWLAPTSVTMISFEQTSETWATPKCLTFGDTSHLYESGLDVKWKGVRKHRSLRRFQLILEGKDEKRWLTSKVSRRSTRTAGTVRSPIWSTGRGTTTSPSGMAEATRVREITAMCL